MRLLFRSLLVSLFLIPVAIGPAEAGRLIEPSAPTSVAVQGVVSDTTGGVVAGATVNAVVAGRSVSRATTGADGAFRVEVPAGVPVELRVRRAGFADQVVAITGDAAPRPQNITLQVGGVSDTLVVTASRAAESRTRVTESVTAFMRADLDALGASSLADIVRFVPGVNVEASGREER